MKQYIRVVLLLIASVSLSWPIRANSFDDAMEKHKKEFEEEARHDFSDALELAKRGDNEAQANVGHWLLKGHGIKLNIVEGIRWLRKAADQGNVSASLELGAIYDDAEVCSDLFPSYKSKRCQDEIPPSPREAAKWYKKAAEGGNKRAQVFLARMCKDGRGVKRDADEATRWYRAAAEQEDVEAQFELASMYAFGEGIPKNPQEAAKWYRAAANQGDATSQFNLGISYYDGDGVIQDYTEAYKWLILAAAQGHEKAGTGAKDISSKLTKEQLADAQKQAAEYQRSLAARHPSIARFNYGISDQQVEEKARPALLPMIREALAGGDTPEEIKKAIIGQGHSAEFADSLLQEFQNRAPESPPQKAPPTSEPRQISDVDRPPFKLEPRPHDYALVIGIEKYRSLPPAEFAERDATTIRQYLLSMGYPERNIISLNAGEATRSKIQAYLEEWLPRNVKTDSTVFFYYAGHGAPNAETKEAYLLPSDGDARFLKTTAYPLKTLYASLNKLKAKEVIVVLDACFSGAGGRSVLAKGARPLVTKVAPPSDLGRLILFTASSEDEITGSLEEKGHGIFTYYFLKGLAGAARDVQGTVSAKSLHEYLKPLVQDEARRQNREQTPVLLGSMDNRAIVRFR